MAEIEITCPECANKRSVPDDLAGKKIKCRKCQSIFTVKAPLPKAKPIAAKPIAAKPAGVQTKAAAQIEQKKIDDAEVIDGKNPYIMREENLAARCPFCAELMDPPDSKICLHCGYDMVKRKRRESKVTFERTFGDYVLHHLPTFGCFVAINILVAFDVIGVMLMEEWIGDAVLPAGCFQLWLIIFSLFPIWKSGRFIFRRLVWNFHPQEKEKKKREDEDD